MTKNPKGPGPGSGKAERYIQPSLLMALAHGNSYGYELIQTIAEYGFLPDEPPPGMIYRHLRQMEGDGLVESSWETSGGGPAKRVYSVTDDGREMLENWVRYMKRQADALSAFVARYETGA